VFGVLEGEEGVEIKIQTYWSSSLFELQFESLIGHENNAIYNCFGTPFLKREIHTCAM
jgi:hypothetical protein